MKTDNSHTADASVRGVRVSHPERILFADNGVSKVEVARYYDQISEHVMPHLKGRPLSLVRCPQGTDAACFFQKHIEDVPVGITHISGDLGEADMIAAQSIEGVIALVQLGVIEFHTWGAREPQIERPDRIVLDLDPDPLLEWQHVIEGAQRVKKLLEELGLPAFLKTTGGKGLHIVIPLRATRTWSEVKAFAKALAGHLEHTHPDRFTSAMAKAKRRGKIFVDYLRNAREATAVSAFSARARTGAPVSMPIAWEELELTTDLRESFFNIRNAYDYINQRGADPWEDYAQKRIGLSARLLAKLHVEVEAA